MFVQKSYRIANIQLPENSPGSLLWLFSSLHWEPKGLWMLCRTSCLQQWMPPQLQGKVSLPTSNIRPAERALDRQLKHGFWMWIRITWDISQHHTWDAQVTLRTTWSRRKKTFQFTKPSNFSSGCFPYHCNPIFAPIHPNRLYCLKINPSLWYNNFFPKNAEKSL